jgi:NitT/TauT family transport system substrate-binding protein
LDIHFEATQGSPPALQTVIAGSALLTPVGDIETMVAASERDAPLVVVGSALPRAGADGLQPPGTQAKSSS